MGDVVPLFGTPEPDPEEEPGPEMTEEVIEKITLLGRQVEDLYDPESMADWLGSITAIKSTLAELP